ncbi:hypothetical protein ACH7U7_002072 [Vibrio cholerae]|nr:hypothetical protein [Vibrio cholerae]
MNLQQMLQEALARVDSMTAEEFEAECITAGYAPVRKHTFSMSEKSMVQTDGMSYRHSVSIRGYEQVDFMLEPANDSTFQLAA